MATKSKKIRLKEEDDDFALLAIASSEDDYHLAWLINQALNIKLSRNENSNSEIFSFIYNDEQQKREYVLINNTSNLQKLAPELAMVDYILKISGNFIKTDVIDIAKSIRNVKEITACIVVNVKNKPLYGVFNRI